MANSEDAASILHSWAYFSCLPRCSWAPIQSLIGAATPYASARSEDLQRLIHESEIMLAPLPDPLKADLGLHKWIAAAREESYSDWLAWVLQEVAESSLLLDLFGFNDPKLAAELQGCSYRIEREKWIKVDEEVFRLDIFIRIIGNGHHDEASLIVELKMGSAEAAETQKQQHYLRWHKKQSVCPRFDRGAFLIVTEAQEMQYFGFEVLCWAEVCIRLRRIIPAINSARGIVKASMVLAFIGAVERNLLHLELQQGGIDPFADAFVAEHLQRTVPSEKGLAVERKSTISIEEGLLREGAASYWLAKAAIKEYEALVRRKCIEVIKAEEDHIAAAVGSRLNAFKDLGEFEAGNHYAGLGISASGSNGCSHHFALWWDRDKLYASVWTRFKDNEKRQRAWLSARIRSADLR